MSGGATAFQGDVTLSVDGLPPGVTCKPQAVGPSLKQAVLVVSAAPDAAPWTGEIKVKGTATINGQPVVREARSASITWAGSPRRRTRTFPCSTRIDRSLVLAVRDKAPFVLTVGQEKVAAPAGDKITLPLKVQRLWPDVKAPVAVTAIGLPTGMTFANTNVANDSGNLVLTIGAQVPPGQLQHRLPRHGPRPVQQRPDGQAESQRQHFPSLHAGDGHGNTEATAQP